MSVFYIRDVEQTKEQIDRLTQTELFDRNIHCMRESLFKYFPNTTTKVNGVDRNFSQEALINNTVYLSAPTNFDDPYDCNLYIDEKKFTLQRIRYFASLCGICINPKWGYADVAYVLASHIYEHISSGRKIEELFDTENVNERVRLMQENFLLRLKNELLLPNADGNSYYRAIDSTLYEEFQSMQNTANRFRIACFAQTPYSMLMWSHYAKYHQGFCIEYETPMLSEDNENIYFNLFPVIYTDKRRDLSSLSVNWNLTGKLSDAELWDFYKYGLLSKSLDWKYQQEWRLVSYDDYLTDKDYNCKFFKIKKVYLGNRMSAKDRLEIIKICKNQGIPYAGVTIALDSFNMRDCDILCEDCDSLTRWQIE